jgi:hypothetical protein
MSEQSKDKGELVSKREAATEVKGRKLSCLDIEFPDEGRGGCLTS